MQNGGGTKYAVDQQINPNTIVFRPAGIFNEKCVIAGEAGTIWEEPTSLALFHLFNKEIRRQYDKIKSFYVGKEAGDLLDKGWRLTSSVKSPALCDLTRD